MTENKDKINVAPRFPKGKKRKKEEIEILAKARLKKRRPKLTKKRVFIPAIAAVLLIMLGFYAAIMSTHYQSTDDAFVEGRIISVAPRVAGPVVNLLVDDNQPVKKGDLLLEVNLDKVKAAGYDTITPVLICNTDDYAAVNGLDGKDVQAGDDVIIITEK